jgi:hypothetical protein
MVYLRYRNRNLSKGEPEPYLVKSRNRSRNHKNSYGSATLKIRHPCIPQLKFKRLENKPKLNKNPFKSSKLRIEKTASRILLMKAGFLYLGPAATTARPAVKGRVAAVRGDGVLLLYSSPP